MWRIYYDDGSTFDSSMGGPEDAPVEGVQVVAEKRDGRFIAHVFGEYFVWLDGKWDIAMKKPNKGIIKVGKLIETEKFKALRAEAFEWLIPS